MKEIELSRGYVALVDDEDFALVSQFHWWTNSHGYAVCRYPGRTSGSMTMHRLILNPPQGFEIDHINGNRVDNRRTNLRIVTATQNRQNQRRRSDNRSGFRGVCWKKHNNKWAAAIASPEKRIHIGYFLTSEEAARAYDEKARELFGPYARLNFPQEGEQRA